MNWYRFKIELSAFAAKVALSTLTAALAIVSLLQPPGTVRSYPVALRFFAQHDWLAPAAFLVLAALMWFCYWKVMRELRSRRAYGER
jgi:hypothetical protein